MERIMPSQVSCICPVCSSLFFVKPSRFKLSRKNGKLCCSVKCREECRERSNPLELFWKHVQKTDGCWLWTGGKDSSGYGSFNWCGLIVPNQYASISAHRASWLIHHGPISDDLRVLHDCDNPPCVRSDHLFLGTQKDNVQDCIQKRRRAEHVGNHKGWCYR